MHYIIWLLFVALAVFNYLDAYQTSVILSLGGIEVNPIMAFAIDHFGIKGMYILKTLLLMVLWLLIWIQTRKYKRVRLAYYPTGEGEE